MEHSECPLSRSARVKVKKGKKVMRTSPEEAGTTVAGRKKGRDVRRECGLGKLGTGDGAQGLE